MSDPLQNLSPCRPSTKIYNNRFSSASEVTEYLKRKTTFNYYNNYTASQKDAYSSTYTTYLAGSIYKDPTSSATCCPSSNSIVQRPEKRTTAFLMNKWVPT
ncbi:hypothetical protein EB118_10925 [bacterium]|nr:hypothetical protein [Actinomycetota bacterium]NDG30568.1 hypothetical protein [bacterium]